MKILLVSLVDTDRLAQIVAKHVRPRDMIILAGEMGAGKTTFTQSFGRALGVTDLITSPTFNLLHNYGSGRMSLHHADLYRLERTGELADLGLDELQDSVQEGGVEVSLQIHAATMFWLEVAVNINSKLLWLQMCRRPVL